ncbi:nucleoside hydrolase [Streptomyces sp. NRRL B-1347]|uniref:nucleoside hydrolase n=1 Tax=Streptomyces sp. NRRL B-1347 TaxID=1476877 RepID=UPI000ABB322D|nr:nucleoside hydrolase [Streptomyces sp. NRRL B-1347]
MALSPIVLDSDPGLDDAVALQYLLGSGLWDLKAYTAVGGNAPMAQVFRNARGLARAFGIDGDVPVHPGAGRTISRVDSASDFHGPTGLGDEVLADSTAPEQSEPAAAALLRLSRRYEGELTVVATGPLTNVAMALLQDPGFAHRVRRLVFMGGAAQAPGNVTALAEFNVWADPDAADIVVSSGIPYTMVGLDATHGWRFTYEDLARLDAAGPGQELTVRIMRTYLKAYESNRGQGDCPLHDPLAVGVAADESFVTTGSGTVAVECASQLGRGQTAFLPEERAGSYAYPPHILDREKHTGRVALGTGPRDFSAHFVETLLRCPTV